MVRSMFRRPLKRSLLRRHRDLHDIDTILDLQWYPSPRGLIFYVAKGFFGVQDDPIPLAVIFEAAAKGFLTWEVA